MHRLSEYISRLENRFEKRLDRLHKKYGSQRKAYILLGCVCWYFYGMLINSIRLGIRQSFDVNSNITSIWIVNPFRNAVAPFTLTGIGVSVAIFILICLLSRKGYDWLSGYRCIRDKRGFDILPDGTHGTSRFMSLHEMQHILDVGKVDDLNGTIYGKHKDNPNDTDEYADYIAASPQSGLAGNILVVGSPGTGKSWRFVRPFIFQCVKRKESIILTDPKAEHYNSMSGYLRDQGYEIRVFNLLDMEFSDHWNCIGEADQDPRLIPVIASTIINNTSTEKEAGDFWTKAELNLLTALLYYVQNETDSVKHQLPLSTRRLGRVLSMLSEDGLRKIDEEFRRLPAGHPAKGPYGLFLNAKENLRGNIVIGLGNRLNVFQDKLVDALTTDSSIDLTLPGQKPCAYFCILSAQDSTYSFLSSLFFTMIFSRLESYARRENNGKLPVTVNFLLEEFPSIGKLGDFKRSIAFTRSFGMNCQVLVQSISQLADIYPRHEWEEIVACCDATICLGVNDLTSAKFISEKSGMTTIRVNNNQSPQVPLFSPLQSMRGSYSVTRGNASRALMQPDEILRLENNKCIVLLRGQLPLLLYKISPQEFHDFDKLRPASIRDYVTEAPASDTPDNKNNAADFKSHEALNTTAPNTDTSSVPRFSMSYRKQADIPIDDSSSASSKTYILSEQEWDTFQNNMDKINQ